jgi:hypothetical protein
MATATSIQAIPNATPYSLKLRVDGQGGGGATLFSIDDFMLHCAEGPLKEFLKSLDPAAVTNLNITWLRGNKIRIYEDPADVSAGRSLPTTIVWQGGVSTALAGLLCTLGTANIRILEIRLNHSTQA